MSSWKEKDFEESQSNNIDRIYKAIYPIKSINRSNRKSSMDELFIDKHLGIDTIIELQNGSSISIQEKIRNANILNKYPPTLCIELMNDQSRGAKGEWFYCVSQYYFLGYVNPLTNNIIRWYLIDTVKLKTLLSNISLEELKLKYEQKNVPPKRATFLAIPIDDIEQAVTCKYYTS